MLKERGGERDEGGREGRRKEGEREREKEREVHVHTLTLTSSVTKFEMVVKERRRLVSL